MPKTISVRLPDDQYELISRLSELGGKSRNAFFQELVDEAAPMLRKMLAVVDQAASYSSPGARVGAAIAIAAEAVSDVSERLENERPEIEAPTL